MASPIKLFIILVVSIATLTLGAPATDNGPTEVMANLTMVEWRNLTAGGVPGDNNALGNILRENRDIPGRGFYAFCNTNDCRDCGNDLGLLDDTCWNERGRHSIIATLDWYSHAVLVSPRPNCPCQSHCPGIIKRMGTQRIGTVCYVLGDQTGLSYRLITADHCPPNNC